MHVQQREEKKPYVVEDMNDKMTRNTSTGSIERRHS
jgi:hypothetical protein